MLHCNGICMYRYEAIRAEIIIQIRKTRLMAVHIDADREMHRSRGALGLGCSFSVSPLEDDFIRIHNGLPMRWSSGRMLSRQAVTILTAGSIQVQTLDGT